MNIAGGESKKERERKKKKEKKERERKELKEKAAEPSRGLVKTLTEVDAAARAALSS